MEALGNGTWHMIFVDSGTYFGTASEATQMSVTYSSNIQTYTAKNCMVMSPQSIITCATVPGAGGPVYWVVSVGGQNSVSVKGIKYRNPTLTGVSGGSSLSTEGGQQVVLSGLDFGPAGVSGVQIIAIYGPQPYDMPCSLTQSSPTAVCTTVEGVGANLTIQIQVAGLISNPIAAALSYLPPSVTSVALPLGMRTMPTTGGTPLMFQGFNFGPSTQTPSVIYFQQGSSMTYSAVQCIAHHTTMSCSSTQGVGTNLIFVVTVGEQSGTSPNTLSYTGTPDCCLGPFWYRLSCSLTLPISFIFLYALLISL